MLSVCPISQISRVQKLMILYFSKTSQVYSTNVSDKILICTGCANEGSNDIDISPRWSDVRIHQDSGSVSVITPLYSVFDLQLSIQTYCHIPSFGHCFPPLLSSCPLSLGLVNTAALYIPVTWLVTRTVTQQELIAWRVWNRLPLDCKRCCEP